MKKHDAQFWVQHLQLISHPEGGYYRETYRSDATIPHAALGADFLGARNVSTAIYFLLEKEQCSSFHRILSDELWHFHTGTSMQIHIIKHDGLLTTLRLGPDADNGDSFQAIVPAGCWFAAEISNKESFGLCSCTVAPGFAFEDFQLADTQELSIEYPEHRELICRMAKT